MYYSSLRRWYITDRYRKKIIYIKEQIRVYFNIKDIGDIDFVIGIKFKKYYDGYFMQQRGYIK